QRGRVQQAGDVAGHGPRRQHLHRVRAAADDRLSGQRQPALDRHVLPGLIRPAVRYGALVALPETSDRRSVWGSALSVFATPTSPPAAAQVLRTILWPIAILFVIHRSYVLATNGFITDDYAPVYNAVVNFKRGLPIYNEQLNFVDPHYLYPPGGTLIMAPFGYLPVDASRYWFITINAIAIIVAAYLLLR